MLESQVEHVFCAKGSMTVLALENFLEWFKKDRSPQSLVYIRPELFSAIQEIAAQDNSPVGAVINDLLHFALDERQSAKASLEVWQKLTPREKEVAALVWFGLTNPQIAARMVISVYTVKAHMRSILAKFDIHSKEELRKMLSSLDFSEWADLWAASPHTPTDSG